MLALRRGWAFFTQALDMARKDPDLLKPSLYALIVNFIITLVVFIPSIAVFVLAVGLEFAFGQLFGQIVTATFGAMLMFIQYIVTYVFAGMTAYLVYQYVTEGDGKMSSAWGIVRRDFLDLVTLAAASTVVNLIENFIRSQGRRAGGIVGVIAGILATALEAVWTVATYFVLPAMVIEDLHLGQALKRATQIIKNNVLFVAVSEIGVRAITGVINFIVVMIAIAFAALSVVGLGTFIGTAGYITGAILAALVFGVLVGVSSIFTSYMTTAYYTMMFIWARENEKADIHTASEQLAAPGPIQAALAIK